MEWNTGWTRPCDWCGRLIDSHMGDHCHTTGLPGGCTLCCTCWCKQHDLARCLPTIDAKKRGATLERV
jgi:hypothetical protein